MKVKKKQNKNKMKLILKVIRKLENLRKKFQRTVFIKLNEEEYIKDGGNFRKIFK